MRTGTEEAAYGHWCSSRARFQPQRLETNCGAPFAQKAAPSRPTAGGNAAERVRTVWVIEAVDACQVREAKEAVQCRLHSGGSPANYEPWDPGHPGPRSGYGSPDWVAAVPPRPKQLQLSCGWSVAGRELYTGSGARTLPLPYACNLATCLGVPGARHAMAESWRG